MNPQSFRVLKRAANGTWQEQEVVSAGSRLLAVEKVAKEPGTYVAVTDAQVMVVEQQVAFKVAATPKAIRAVA